MILRPLPSKILHHQSPGPTVSPLRLKETSKPPSGPTHSPDPSNNPPILLCNPKEVPKLNNSCVYDRIITQDTQTQTRLKIFSYQSQWPQPVLLLSSTGVNMSFPNPDMQTSVTASVFQENWAKTLWHVHHSMQPTISHEPTSRSSSQKWKPLSTVSHTSWSHNYACLSLTHTHHLFIPSRGALLLPTSSP